MGIGNRRDVAIREGRIGPHYPSWGSGTTTAPRTMPPGSRLITPHGDREPGHGEGDRPARSGLITPHGDREPRYGSSRTAGIMTHYPSWGSGTGRDRLGADGTGSLLITPHGDRERVRRASSTPSYEVSLPLMGIGNVSLAPNAETVEVLLITPHGDRERPRATRRSPQIHGTHYPSWGSGTQRVYVLLFEHALPRSLPLMGIGNLTT